LQIFPTPYVSSALGGSDPHQNFTEIFGIRKLESLLYRAALFTWCCV